MLERSWKPEELEVRRMVEEGVEQRGPQPQEEEGQKSV